MSAARKPVAPRPKPKSGGRSMTFTGCWTCKRRKVKCDERPQRCTNCERMDIPCDGYGVKLQWMADPFAEPRTSQSQIRGRIRIGRDEGAIYSMEAIDAFLSTLERDVGSSSGRPSQRGPFTVFLGNDQGNCSGTTSTTSAPSAPDTCQQWPRRQRPHEAREVVSPATSVGLSISGDLPGELPENVPAQLPSPAFPEVEIETYDESMDFLSVETVECTSFPSPELSIPQAPTPTLATVLPTRSPPNTEDTDTLFAGNNGFLEDMLEADLDPEEDQVLDEDDLDDADDVGGVDDVDEVVREPSPDVHRNTSQLDQVDGQMRQLGYSANFSSNYSAEMIIPGSVFASVSADTTINKLMHHYVIHVAGLLQPIDHPQNPYRTLYVPAALTAASRPPTQTPTITDPNSTIHSVLLHSLMSSASFHLWNCNPAYAEYHKLGAQHRRESLRLLNTALERHASAIDYKTLMMAMLSLVSIDIMSGCEADFVVHLRGTKQLQQRRKNFRLMSRATRQLNQISDFLFLLTRTTWFPMSLADLSTSPYAVDDDDEGSVEDKTLDKMVDSCYPYMYGISPTLASYMNETCRLAECLKGHELRHGDTEPPPEPLLEACERLGDRILSWTHALEEEDDGRILSSTGDPLARAIFRPHAQAWHLAIVIYYFRRIHRTRGPDHAQHVLTIAQCMHEVEDIKERALSNYASSSVAMRRRAAVSMAPITWPAFIASCEGLHRGPWMRWWQRVQCYQIANIRRQWEMVEKLWQHKDQMEQAGQAASFDWTKVFRGYELTLMPI
ncbi:c6 zinc finger domain protein [Ophiostoma piceae UAMH 11346]|uniref:C6 zinc finger domain protein n=1 Tax=Ophiostoma piceae (strain UAMH 11346) TaxID=1262450 RepID=S3CYA6_OPHP1|nr:c6 zinc finger domain protein [Ophiostoma piceae UAMH 11346]